MGDEGHLNIGIILLAGASLGASWSTKILQSFPGQALCFGPEECNSALPSIIPQRFDRRRSFENAIVTADSRIGGLIHSLLTDAMIQRWGIRWAFGILAILSATACGLSAIIIKNRTEAIGAFQAALHTGLSKRPEFLLTLLWGYFSVLGYVALFFSIPSYESIVGLSVSLGSSLCAILNLGGGLRQPFR